MLCIIITIDTINIHNILKLVYQKKIKLEIVVGYV